jgi:dihydroorotate dehydrogenase electron transfer subunit
LTLPGKSPENLPMSDVERAFARSCDGTVTANVQVSSGLIRLDLELDQGVEFQPGQFAMLNLAGPGAFVFSRPFSIFAADGRLVSFLYRRVGRGTEAMGHLAPGARMSFLGPLGRAFPEPSADEPVILIAGGVGLPPLAAWLERHSASPAGVQAFFGARDGADVPWELLGGKWGVSVDILKDVPPGRTAWEGLVTDLVAAKEELAGGIGRTVFSCGPTPLLKAAARLAAQRGWDCWLSLEEHMGCGYGVCKGCVVPVHDSSTGGAAVRNATCCQDGPVFRADDLAWESPDPNLPAAGRSVS